MSLEESYKSIKPSIVAIASLISSSPDIAEIIGTGFIARENGVIVTNDHVVKAIDKLPRLKGHEHEWPAVVVFFHFLPNKGMIVGHLEIDGVATLSRTSPIPAEAKYYGPLVPDIGIIKVKIKSGLPIVKISSVMEVGEGHEIAMAGFPLGSKPLIRSGYLEQLSPTLQRGIVSAILPFPCPDPHGIVLDLPAQGGSSGSPIFNPENSEVIGMLWGGFLGTSISYGISANILSAILKQVDTSADLFKHDSEYPTFEELLGSNVIKERVPRKPNLDAKPLFQEDIIEPLK
jgi:S1-C subfamily serine protease